MTSPADSVRVLRLGEGSLVEVAGGIFQPVRRELGVRAFAVNVYIAREAGDQLIERHDELGAGSGRQEELYVVVSGRASFTVDDVEVDAPAGTLVFVPNVSAKREAVATEPGTSALVVGGPADRPLPVSPFEYWFVAEAPYRAGDYDRAYEIAAEGLDAWPDHPHLHYQLACYSALGGEHERALVHLARACEGDPRMKEWAREDADFDAVRGAAEFETIVS